MQTQAIKFPGLEQVASLKNVIIAMNYEPLVTKYSRPNFTGRGSRQGKTTFVNDMLAAMKPMKALESLELEDIVCDVKLSR